uniref:Rho guanine nucleotide exchange factor 7 n=1 Tax=Lygus hesperus TaxID=30085 RepID=A0A0A9ZJ98_LYGHE
MGSEGQPFMVQAVYSFKGQNNDELCFKKGDIITVTQAEEGGWWEGTFRDVTGWFPSNYVKEYKPSENVSLSPLKTGSDLVAQQRAYRTVVLNDFIESERVHINELQQLIVNYLQPIEKSHLVTKDEYATILNNLKEVITLHEVILGGVETAITKAPGEQRVGKLFLSVAPKFSQIHTTYCSGHPKAVFVLNKYKEQLTCLVQAESTNLLTFIAGLSKPFRRIEKYSNHLQELERHLEESHPDRGDTQRAVSVYKEIASSCMMLRRQKEMEVEIANGGVRGWEGPEIAKLGQIVHMGSVAVMPDHKDRYLVLFPSTLLMLSTSHRMSAFIYEGKLPLAGITISKLEDSENYKNAFEISGSLIEKIVAICQTREDQHKWVELISNQCSIVGAKNSPLSRKSENILIDPNFEGPWSISCLRPSPPSKSCLLKIDPPPIRNDKFEEDAQILRVIESYCTSSNTRFTLNSDQMESAVTTDDKENEVTMQVKEVPGAVGDLHERILLIQNELETLKTHVEREHSAREQLEALVQRLSCKGTSELIITE